MSNPKHFVTTIELDPADDELSSVSDYQQFSLESGEDQKVQAFINDKSLISFVSGVSGQTRTDVLNSTLIAQLAASKQFPAEVAIDDWYKAYVGTLQQIGWTVASNDFTTFDVGHNLFEVESALLEILGTALGGTYLIVIKKTLEALKGLADKDKRITVFERNTNAVSKGLFQIGLVDETNGAVALRLGVFILTSEDEITKVLFFKSTKNRSELKYTLNNLSLNPEIYNLVRQGIMDKLGDRVTKYVASIDIGDL